MIAYFTGVHPPDDAGHHCYRPSGRWALHPREPGAHPSPWPSHSCLLGDGPPQEVGWGERPGYGSREEATHPAAVQPEGIGRVVHRDGWTLLTCWDRSADTRKGSHASFAFSADLDPADALARARELFPRVWARIDAHLVAKGIAFRVESPQESP